MDNRECVLRALSLERPGPLVSDFWAEDAAKNRLFATMNHRDLNRFLNDMDVDIRHISAKSPNAAYNGMYYQNVWGERYVMQSTEWGGMREDLPGALSECECLEDIAAFAWPNVDDVDYSGLREDCDKYAGYAIMYGEGDIWQRQALSRGFENGLMDLLANPEWVSFMARKYVDYYKEDYARAYDRSGRKIDLFVIFSDLGSQRSPLMSCDIFSDLILPYLRELVDWIHLLGANVMFHSCGMIQPFIPKLIEIGVDVLDPMQPVTAEMLPEELNNQFGARLCFHGGIDVQGVLRSGSEESVRSEVRRYAEAFGGGYICCSTHFIQPDISAENVLAMYDEIKQLKYTQ